MGCKYIALVGNSTAQCQFSSVVAKFHQVVAKVKYMLKYMPAIVASAIYS